MTLYHLDIEQFWREGICWPIGRVEVTGLVDHFFEIQQTAISQRGREVHIQPHLVSTRIDALVHDPIILDSVEKILGPDFVLWESDFARKPPGGTGWVPWHSDAPYWNLSTNEVVTVWVALNKVTRDNAAMQVVPRTHLQPDLAKLNIQGDPHEGYKTGNRKSSEGNVFAYDTILQREIDPERDAVSVELKPGEFSIHHVNLLHGGGPNTSAMDRIGVAMRFMSARTYCRSGRDSVMLMRGQADSEHFEFEQRPQTDFSKSSWQAFEYAMQFPSGFGDRLIESKSTEENQ